MDIGNKSYVFLYFLFLTIIALSLTTSLPLDTTRTLIHFNSTNSDITNAFGGMDPGSFAKGSLIIYANNWFNTESMGFINLWPPGFMVLQGGLLKLFGLNAPMVGILQILAAFVLAIACNLFRLCLSRYVRPLLATLIPLTLLFSSQFLSFMLNPEAVLLGETFSISFVLIGLFSLLWAYTKNSKFLAVLAGVSFALSAYFRSQFEMFFMIASINFAVILLAIGIYKMTHAFRHPKRNNTIPQTLRTPLLLIFVSLVTFHALTLPYKMYTHDRTGSYLWVQTSQLMLRNNFIPSQELAMIGHSFLTGGANVGCIVDPVNCLKIHKQIVDGTISKRELKKYAKSAFLNHPLLWISTKIQLFPPYWFTNLAIYYDLSTPHIVTFSFFANFFNYVFILCFAFSLIYMLITIRNPYSIITYWLSSSICFAYMVIFVISHYESRYFFFFKFYFLALAIFCFVQMLSSRQNKIE